MTSVRDTHVKLYVGIVGYGLWGILIGLAMIFTPSHTPYDIPRQFLGILYIFFGILKIIGANNLQRYTIARVGMNLCISLTILLGIGLLLNYLSGDHSQDLYLIVGYVFAGAFIQVAPAQEPPHNPLTQAKKVNKVDVT